MVSTTRSSAEDTVGDLVLTNDGASVYLGRPPARTSPGCRVAR
jgi:hypothetical protein